MEVVLFRHGIAAPRETHPGPDASRELTEHGILRTRAAARGLVALGVQPQVVVASPLARARQTAELLVEILGVRRPAVLLDELTPGALPGTVLAGLDALGTGSLLCVGHAPDLDVLLRGLLDGGVVPVTALKKAGAACVECQHPAARRGELRWLASPRMLRSLGKGEG